MYLTDLTDAQKEYIRGTILMDNWRSKYDFFLILDAIIYIDVSGCQWRLLPEEYPKWQTVYYYFRRWGAMDAFSELEDSLVEKVRLRRGESPHPTIGAIDSESSRSALPRSQKGFDGNKKVKGVKRNIITDKDGDILEASTTPANIHDSKSAYALVAMLVVAFPWIRRIYADRGYRGNFIEEAKHDFGIDIEITHSNYSGQFVPAKKRWVVERTFAWLENFRRLCRNYEETTESANEMLMVAAVVISLRKLTSVNNRF